jgi:hypothetical protein
MPNGGRCIERHVRVGRTTRGTVCSCLLHTGSKRLVAVSETATIRTQSTHIDPSQPRKSGRQQDAATFGGCNAWMDMLWRESRLTVYQSNFNHILRLLNTNVDGKQKVVYSLT